MKILIIANSSGGLYLFRGMLMKALVSEGHELFALTPVNEKREEIEKIGVSLIDIKMDRRGINPLKDIDLFYKYNKIVKMIKPDLIITYTIKPNIYGGIACRLRHTAYVSNITGLGTAFQNEGFIKKVAVLLYKIALKEAKTVFFENSGDRDKLVAYKTCKPDQTYVLNGAGVNLEQFYYQPYPNNDKVRFLFVGRVMKEKGIDELFDSMKRFVSEGYKCFLDVVGPFEENYKEKLEQCESEGWLKYQGYQEDVRPFIAACDCFVLPSYHEGMANTNLECASSGRPIITSNIPGCKEAVIDGVSGFLCEPKNVDSLYEAMKRMMRLSREEREQIGKAGRKHMENVFDKRKVVEETINYLFS